MSKSINEGQPLRRMVTWIVAFFARVSGFVASLVLVLGVVLILTLPFVLDREPGFDISGAPDAAKAANAADFARSLSTLLTDDERNLQWSARVVDLNGALATASRVVPGVWLRVRDQDGPATFEAAIDLSRFPGDFWLNAQIGIKGSNEGVKLTKVRLGDLALPGGLVLNLLQYTANRVLKDGLGDTLLNSVLDAQVGNGALNVRLAFSNGQRNVLALRIREVLRDVSGSPDTALVYSYLWMFAREGRERGLPAGGSVLPYLEYVLRQSAWHGEGSSLEQGQAALLALAIYCGDESLSSVIGLVPRTSGRNYCQDTRLRGRDDLKRHFVISAGLYAAQSGITAGGIGELKELLDSNTGGTGFSFDDMAANAAGIRFAETMLNSTPVQRLRLAKLLVDEGSVFPSTEGLPTGLSEAEFQAVYGDVNSAEYSDLLNVIEERIDGLSFHQGKQSPQ